MFIHYGVVSRTGEDGGERVERIRQAQEESPAWPLETPWQADLERILTGPAEPLHRLKPAEITRSSDVLARRTSGERMFDEARVVCYWYLTPASTLQLSVVLPSEDSGGETILGVILSADVLSDRSWEIAEAGEMLRDSPMLTALAELFGSAD